MASDRIINPTEGHIKPLNKEYEGYCIDVGTTIYNYRIYRSVEEHTSYDMHFCYPMDKVSILDVLLWAYQWSGIDGSVPDGPWVKAWLITQDGKRQTVHRPRGDDYNIIS